MKRITLLIITALAAMLAFSAGLVAASDDGYPDYDIIYTEPVVGVVFSHTFHVEEAGMDCDSCHDGVFEMEAQAAQAQPDYNMLALSEGRYCGVCHDGDTAFDSNSRCASCHIGVIGYNRANGIEEAAHGGH